MHAKNLMRFLPIALLTLTLTSCANMQAMIDSQTQEQKEISVDYAEKFCDHKVAVSKDLIIVESILGMLENYKSVILPNLFAEFTETKNEKVLYSVIPRNYCDHG